MIKCGHCHEHHDNIDAVMVCASNHGFRSAPRKPVSVEDVQAELSKPGPLWGWNDKVRAVKPTEQRREVAQRDLLDQINKIGATIPVGRYAIRNQTGPNNLGFYVIERPEHGRYAGKTFVKQQLSDELDRVPRARQLAVLTAIAADIRGAAIRYGHEIGRCAICNRTLTNEESRAAGIGPKCAKANGWDAA